MMGVNAHRPRSTRPRTTAPSDGAYVYQIAHDVFLFSITGVHVGVIDRM